MRDNPTALFEITIVEQHTFELIVITTLAEFLSSLRCVFKRMYFYRKYFHITRGNETAIRFRILTILPLQQRKCSTSKNSPSYSIAQFVVIYCAMHVTHYGRVVSYFLLHFLLHM